MRRYLLIVAPVLWIAALLPVMAAGTPAGNPHRDIACSECHLNVPEKGKAAPAEVLAGLKKSPVELCRDCHSEADVSHHPVTKRTQRRLPEGLPLSAEGDVICSTCHDIHQETVSTYLLRGFDTGRYSVRMDLCLDCHGETFSVMNPHYAGADSEKCRTCHVGKPGAADSPEGAKLLGNIEKICDFCHNVRAKAHPGNVDTMKTLPRGLPLGKGGEVICGTCHDPHGTPSTIHFLRKIYVEALERGRYSNPHGKKDYASCQGCHLEVRVKREEMRTNLRYAGDDMRICHSCHGAMDACHPVLITLPETMKPGKDLPLTRDGKIKCLTCHDPMAEGGSGVAVRRKEKGEPVNAICFRCHDKVDLSSRNPHATMSNRELCRFCHDTMTDPTNEEAGRVSFISNTRLICLRCHAQENHPMGVNHMVLPKQELPEPFKPDGRGRLTCTTCHNPHIDVREEGGRIRRFVIKGEGSAICSRCHRR